MHTHSRGGTCVYLWLLTHPSHPRSACPPARSLYFLRGAAKPKTTLPSKAVKHIKRARIMHTLFSFFWPPRSFSTGCLADTCCYISAARSLSCRIVIQESRRGDSLAAQWQPEGAPLPSWRMSPLWCLPQRAPPPAVSHTTVPLMNWWRMNGGATRAGL